MNSFFNLPVKSCKRLLCTFIGGPLSHPISISEKFAFCLENCSDILSLKKLHASIFVYGLGDVRFLGSKLITCYAKFDLLTESRWVFDRIINNSLFLWNSLLAGYFRAGHYKEVQWRYLNLRQRSICLDSSVIIICLKSCIEYGCLNFGKGVHLDAFKFGLNSNSFVGSSLIVLYANYGDIVDASKVFDEITQKDVVVYTSMITGYAKIGDHRAYGAFRIAGNMQQEKLDPNRVTLVSLLQAAAQLALLHEGRSIHGYAIRRGIGCSDEVLETSFTDMYIKCGDPKSAACIFGKMNVRNIGSWNAMIAGYHKMGQPLEALNLFYFMVQENIMPDLITLANGIMCCADLAYLREGKSIHCFILRMGFHLDLVAMTALIDMYSKCNCLVQASKLFNKTEPRDVILCNVMMEGYLHNEFASEAVKTFSEMVRGCIKPNIGSFLNVLGALSNLKDGKQGRCVHGHVLRQGFHLNVEVANQIIHMYANCGCIYYARQVFNRLRNRDLVSWTSMMRGYTQHGQANESIYLFRLLQREQVEHDSVALTILLQAFCQLGHLSLAKEVHCHLYRALFKRDIPVTNSLITTYAKCGKLNMARNIFENATEKCITSWNAMVAAYGMHGDCVNALKLFAYMKEENIEPDEITFTSLLTACSHSGLVEDGLHVFRSMTEEYYIKPCEEHFSCLVDLLSRGGQLEEAYNLIKFLPLGQRAQALGALLAACRVHRNAEIGLMIGKDLLDLEPENASAYILVSNLYAECGKWDDAAKIRSTTKEKGLRRTHGYSLIETNKHVKDATISRTRLS
ncbi:pentatricopeptide repeat-containing protein At4g21300 [Manihot esculenta]|uniref:Uncharacterized protein n=2 Tax=Manihot esculenta TaxID=3983 RepID=A0ACB7IDV9_MANES|nr:pentatricopeptide repeat-containing protein At4g21300 [Manihot esculenta]KAG8662394.1 hypothetical protein MANES_01G099600v8 [Manihot esculenta]OAY60272.1 hypothetical protein MANES_01G099600v8 [Manihot esculenta]